MIFSIIVPVYNVEKYIKKCLDSLKDQTYENFEIIIVNDGSEEQEEKIIKKYLKDKRFKYFVKENGGLSDARNYGIKYVSGDYILFVDSDDYIEKDLLKKLNNILTKTQYDMIKFNFNDVIENKKIKHSEKLVGSKKVFIKDLINFDYFEAACGYCYNSSFYKDNNFSFERGKYHEDFGLIPFILLKTESIYYLDYYGYNYLQRENSIVNDQSKNIKKVNDIFFFGINNIKKIMADQTILKYNKELILNFYASGLINSLKKIKQKDEYKKKLKEIKIYRYLLNNTIKQKIKRLVCMISYDLYLKLF